MKKNDTVNSYLEFYMGKTPRRVRIFIIENLRVEEDVEEEER